MEEIIEYLKGQGYRITETRVKILEVFFDNIEEHLSMEEILNKLKEKKEVVNVASVYNTLNILIKEKIVEQYNFGNKKVFELANALHGHFICRNCERTLNINVPGMDCLDALIYKKYSARVDESKIEFYGICEECQQRGEDEFDQ